MARKKSRPSRRRIVTPPSREHDANPEEDATASATSNDDSGVGGGGGGRGMGIGIGIDGGGGIISSLISNLFPSSSSSSASTPSSPPATEGGDVANNEDRLENADDDDGDTMSTTVASPRRRRVRLEVIPDPSSSSDPSELGAEVSGGEGGVVVVVGGGESSSSEGIGGDHDDETSTTTLNLGLTIMVGDDCCTGGGDEGGVSEDGGDGMGAGEGSTSMSSSSSSEEEGHVTDEYDDSGANAGTFSTPTTIVRFVLRSSSTDRSSSDRTSVGGGVGGGGPYRLHLSVSLDGWSSGDDPGKTTGCFGEKSAPPGRMKGVVLTDEGDLEDVLALCLMMNYGGGNDDDDDRPKEKDERIIDDDNEEEENGDGGEGSSSSSTLVGGGRPALLDRWRERAGPLVDAVHDGLMSLSVSVLKTSSSSESCCQSQPTTSSKPHLVAVEAVEVELSLTPLAFEMCSPLPPPASTKTKLAAPLPLRSNHMSRKPPAALTLRSALGVLFPDTVIADVARDPNPTSTSSSRSRGAGGAGQERNVITAKMIYDVIDDAHSKEWCCHPQDDGGHGRHGCLNLGRGGQREDDDDGDEDGGDADGGVGFGDGGDGVEDGDGGGDEGGTNRRTKPGRRPPLEVEGLRPTLRPYQEAAVRWMLSREMATGGTVRSASSASVDSPMEVDGAGGDHDGDDGEDTCWELAWVVVIPLDTPTLDRPSIASGGDVVIPLYEWRRRERGCGVGRERRGDDEDHDDGGVTVTPPLPLLFYNPFTGWICRSLREARFATVLGHCPPAGVGGDLSSSSQEREVGSSSHHHHRVRGGILADSMGTGKTVEVLACILGNRCPDANVGGGGGDGDGDGDGDGGTAVDDAGTDDDVEMLQGVSKGGEAAAATTSIETTDGKIRVGRDDTQEETHGCSASAVVSASSGGSGGESCSSSSSSSSDGDGDVASATRPEEDDCDRPDGGVDEAAVTMSEVCVDGGEDVDDGFNDIDGGACICGRDGTFRGCLGWVYCRGCGDRMHGLCAGFASRAGVLRSCDRIVGGDGSSSPPRTWWCSGDRCPCCVAAGSLSGGSGGPTIRSRATLIVTPPSILEQWRREIRRHTTSNTTADGLRVVVYPGMRELCGNASSRTASKRMDVSSLMHPRRLADADVVLTTFQTLMGDLGHSGDNPCLATKTHRVGNQQEQRRRRKRKRFRVVPSPLTCITWWRVCLDEAQRVEAPTAASARMALLLPARNRWCVTGTPVGRGKLDDLHGLLLFLGVAPFGRDKAWFRHCLHGSHRGATDRLSHLLRDVLWRSTKANDCVRLQMGIPRQEERRVVLKFSSVERHFYQRQLEETILTVSSMKHESSGGEKTTGRRLASARNKKETTALSMQLHRLRAACCHPQVGSGGLGRAFGPNRSGARGGGVSSGVLTMDQILDRLIDDAKTKCEESLRLAVLHSNALASLTRLRVEARGRSSIGGDGGDREVEANSSGEEKSDRALLLESGEIYMDSLSLMNSNATPCEVAGEAVLNGCAGFLDARKVVRDGMALFRWQLKCWNELGIVKGRDTSYAGSTDASSQRKVWARIDFEGPAKKLVSFRVRQRRSLPEDYDRDSWRLLLPKRCVLQCSNASVGGEFVDVRSFELTFSAGDDDWLDFDGFRTNKSKSWRIVVNDYHESPTPQSLDSMHCFVALEVQFFEPNIAADDLQRQHIMHNAMLVFGAALQQREGSMRDEDSVECAAGGPAASEVNGIEEKLALMQTESEKLDVLYMGTARVVHRESKRQLQRATNSRAALESELESLRNSVNDGRDISCGSDPWLWWSNLLAVCHMHGTEEQNAALCEAVQRDVAAFLEQFENSERNTTENRERYSFPAFNDEDGLLAALTMRMQSIGVAGSRLEARGLSSVHAVAALSENPSDGDVVENGNCRKCRDYFFRTGPICRHCKLEEKLLADEAKLLVEESSLMCALKALAKWLADNRISFKGCHYQYLSFLERSANKFFAAHASYRKEMAMAKRAWRAHFDLLSDLDELSQSKSSMRLLRDGEDLCSLQPHELDTVVPPGSIDAMCMDHDSKQAMALSTLRRNKDTLRYLRNQSMRRKQQVRKRPSSSDTQITNRSSCEDQDEKQTCVVCLCDLAGEHAVLACGHCFHYSPCLEKLAKGGGSGTTIACPMRCILRTRKDEIFIASDKRRDDGSRISRSIEGCWGTKVERLVSDVMDVIEMGEKSLIFSQWDDMLAIVEEAFRVNGIRYVRPKGQKSVGCCVLKFRNGLEHPVLLMNVKSGAEGLTLVEATHVFMVEPLLNCGLDQQAINRVHRIGQTCKTFVHRYIVENTIEGKIDELRVDRQGSHNEGEATSKALSRNSIPAGGIDGGFSREELHRILQ